MKEYKAPIVMLGAIKGNSGDQEKGNEAEMHRRDSLSKQMKRDELVLCY